MISPFLVKLMLVLLYEATGVGEISGANPLSTELRLVLEPNGDLQDTRTNYQQLLESVLKSDSMYDVRLDTKFFLDDYIDVASKYELIVEHFYNASAENVPFSKPREAVEVINDWANSVTQGRINKLVSEGEFVVYTLIRFFFIFDSSKFQLTSPTQLSRWPALLPSKDSGNPHFQQVIQGRVFLTGFK